MKNDSGKFLQIVSLNGFSLLLSSSANVGIAIYFFDQSGSASFMATVVAFHYGSLIYSSVLAGYVVQRWTPLKVLNWSNLALGCTSLALFALLSIDFKSVPALAFLSISAVAGFLEGLSSLSLMSATIQFISKEDLLRWNGLTGLIENTPFLVGPPLGALLYSAGLLQTSVILDSVSFFCTSLVAWWRIGNVSRISKNATSSEVASERRRIFSGVSLIFKNRSLRNIQLSYTLLNFLNGLVAGILPYYILSAAKFPASALALSNTFMGVGLLLGALILSRAPTRVRAAHWVLAGLLLGALSRSLLAISASLFTIASSSLFRGAGNQIGNSALMVILQTFVPARDQPAVFGARRFLSQGLYPFSLGISGALVTVGVGQWGNSFTSWYIFFISLFELFVFAFLYFSRALNDMENLAKVERASSPRR